MRSSDYNLGSASWLALAMVLRRKLAAPINEDLFSLLKEDSAARWYTTHSEQAEEDRMCWDVVSV